MTLFAETACRRFTQDSKDQFTTIKDNLSSSSTAYGHHYPRAEPFHRSDGRAVFPAVPAPQRLQIRTASGALIVMSPTEEKPASVTQIAARHVEQAN